MIVTVTLNPTLDKALSVAYLEPGTVHRALLLRQDLGGKGINVSRALQGLGIPSRLAGFLGGATGQAMREGLKNEGYDIHFIEVGSETRQNLTLLDVARQQYTKINEPGAAIMPRHIKALKQWIDFIATPDDLWAFCGSLPPGAPDDLYADLIRQVQERGARAFLDTSGPPLRAGLAAQPFGLKPNSEEAAEMLGRPVKSDQEHVDAVRDLLAGGIRLVTLSRGGQGLVLGMGEQIIMATPPPVDARSPVGAGDSALASLLWGLTEGCDASELAARAVACGTAAAMQEGTGVGDLALVEHLRDRVKVVPASPAS